MKKNKFTKKKVFSSILMFLFFLVFAYVEREKEVLTYKVIDVLEGDKIVVDLNSNGKRDKGETIHIKDINTFPLKYSSKNEYYQSRFRLSPDETATLGYLAKDFTKRKLLDNQIILKEISEYNENYSYRFARVKFQGRDFASVLLEEGLAVSYEGKGFNPYKAQIDVRKLKANAKEYFEPNLVLIDKKYKLFHTPSCAKTEKIKEFDIILKQDLKRGYKPCIYCIEKLKQNEKPKINAVSPAKTFNNVKIFLIHPLSFDKPSFFCKTAAGKELLSQINGAKESIDFALYGLDNQEEVLKALIAAKKRGVKIRGVSDTNAKGAFAYNDTKKLVENFEVILDKQAPIMHNKFFIFDNKRVFTGTMNISKTGSGGYNSNTALLINDVQTAALYLKEFEQMFNGKFQQNKADFSFQGLKLNNDTTLDVFFPPASNPYAKRISSLIKGASREVFVSAFYLTNKDLANDLMEAKRHGADVRVIYDAVGANNMKAIVNSLRSAGVKVKVENWGGKNHEKNILIDGEYFITGSANLSNSGYKKNDENVLIFKNKEIAKFYREHYLNLYNSIDDKYLKFTPRAESFESGNSCYDGIDNNFDGKLDSEDIGCKKKS